MAPFREPVRSADGLVRAGLYLRTCGRGRPRSDSEVQRANRSGKSLPRQNLRRVANFTVLAAFTALFLLGASAVSGETVPADDLESANARSLYNSGTRDLTQGKLNDAEAMLRAALAKQDAAVQPAALYNLGHVRFGQGLEELKKKLSGRATTTDGAAAVSAGAQAIRAGEAALETNDVQEMITAYQNGRGVRKEMRDIELAVRRAMEVFGNTLTKWNRALDDFKSASELDPANHDAAQNAQAVERAIAKLVDSVREMQRMAQSLGNGRSRLNEVLRQLKGRIPKEQMPPGAAGNDEDDEDGDKRPERLSGFEASPIEGHQTEMMLSPDEAARLIENVPIVERRLSSSPSQPGEPRERPRRTW